MQAEGELETVRRQLADLEQLADVGFWDFDVASGTVVWSDGQCRLYGVDPATFDATYDAWFAMVHPDDWEMIGATIGEAIERCGDYGFDHRFHRATDGDLRWTRCRGRVFPGPDGTAERIFGISIDTTAEHRTSETLTEFIADAAHELRTPSAAIAQAVPALRNLAGDDREAVLGALERQANRLRTLTTNLVDLVLVEEGPSAALLEPVDLSVAVTAAAHTTPPPAGRVLDVDGVPPGLRARADIVALDRILANLLSNAWRYGGTTVRISAASLDDGKVELRVADDGEGVSAALEPTLFQPFRRGQQRHPEASGLGLAIVERLVRSQGGTVRYEASEGGVGATFVVTLDGA